MRDTMRDKLRDRLGLTSIDSTIHPYPIQAEAIRRLGDQYSRTRLTRLVKSLFQQVAGVDALTNHSKEILQ